MTIKQPWLWAIIHGGKTLENRNWRPTIPAGTRIALHASRTCDSDGTWVTVRDLCGTAPPPERFMKLGCVVATAEYRGCVTESDSPWFVGRFGLLLGDVRVVRPVPVRGALGLWQLPTDVVLDETGDLTWEDRQETLRTFREHFGMTDADVVERRLAGTLLGDPEFAEWLFLLGRGDLL